MLMSARRRASLLLFNLPSRRGTYFTCAVSHQNAEKEELLAALGQNYRKDENGREALQLSCFQRQLPTIDNSQSTVQVPEVCRFAFLKAF